MKAAAGCMLIGCFFSAGIRAQESGRYATPQFFKVKTVYSIPYSRATSIGKTSPDTLYLDFYEPLRDTLAARPLVIVVFGGSFVAGSRNNDDNVAYCKRLATYGYATASIDYRLMPLLNISAKNIVRDAYMAIQDVSAAVRFFKANHQTYRIDTNNIFLLGNSAGSIAILHEIYMADDERPAETREQPDLGGVHSTGFEAYSNCSPRVAGAISQWGSIWSLDIITPSKHVPLCMIHGTADGTVPIDSGHCYGYQSLPYMYGSRAISGRLEALGVSTYEFHPVKGEGHSFYYTDAYLLDKKKFEICFDIVHDFLLRCLNLPNGIQEPGTVRQLSLYPSPAADYVTVRNEGSASQQLSSIEVLNTMGQTVAHVRDAANPMVMQVSDFPPGVYIVRMVCGSETYAGKFIKK